MAMFFIHQIYPLFHSSSLSSNLNTDSAELLKNCFVCRPINYFPDSGIIEKRLKNVPKEVEYKDGNGNSSP